MRDCRNGVDDDSVDDNDDDDDNNSSNSNSNRHGTCNTKDHYCDCFAPIRVQVNRTSALGLKRDCAGSSCASAAKRAMRATSRGDVSLSSNAKSVSDS